MSHRAFVFDEAGYRTTLARALTSALEDGEPDNLKAFVRDRFPDEDADAGSITLCEKALEAFYDPAVDIGLGMAVGVARAALNQAYPEGIAFLTGAILPLHGWYVQSAETVAKHLPLVEEAARHDALNHETLLQVAAMLRTAQGRGLLVKG
jgi:hypothetical protein